MRFVAIGFADTAAPTVVCISSLLTPLWYHGVYVTPILLNSRFFKTVTNTDIAFHVFLRKAFLTMSHTFARFCVFSFNFYLCLFPLRDKRTPTVPSM